MIEDGHIDYSGYSKNRLQDVLREVDRERFPKNHENAQRQLRRLNTDDVGGSEGEGAKDSPPHSDKREQQTERAPVLEASSEWTSILFLGGFAVLALFTGEIYPPCKRCDAVLRVEDPYLFWGIFALYIGLCIHGAYYAIIRTLQTLRSIVRLNQV